MDTRKMLFARYRLNHEALREFDIYVLDFPYREVIDEFLKVIARNPARQKEKFLFTFDEDLPFRRLNPVLVGAFPHAIQGFETYGNKKDKIYMSGLRRNVKPRRMIALDLHRGDEVEQSPVVGTMDFIIQEWLEEWVRTNFVEGRFGDELKLFGGAAQTAFDTMMDTIPEIELQWKRISASELWQKQQDKNEDSLTRLAYNALPGLLAAQFVESVRGQDVRLRGKNDDYVIRDWWLTQGGGSRNRYLAVVSEPITWRSGKQEGKFSYLLQFVIQTQARSPQPRVAVYIRVRRWITKPLKRTNFRRDVSVYLKLAAPWTQNGHFSSTLIQLKLTGRYDKTDKRTISNLKWKDNPSSLIQNLRGGREQGLIDPETLVSQPAQYHHHENDQYYGLHAEGMDYTGSGTGHPVQTGTALNLRGQLMPIITEHLGTYLTPDTPLGVDPLATLQIKGRSKDWHSVRGDKLIALFNHKDLEQISLSPHGASDEAKIQQKMALTVEALMTASQNRRVRILTFYRGEGGRTTLPKYISKTLFLDDNTELPVQIEVVPPIAIPDALGEPPALEYKTQPDIAKKSYIRREFDQKTDDWVDFLKQAVEDDAYHLAFIEMDPEKFQFEDCTKWLKQAMRRACVEVGINSQMIYFIPPESINPEKSLRYTGDLSRVINASYDLLLRQTALRYGPPSQIYELAGLPPDEAQQLIVVGLYRHVADLPVSVDYPVAVVSYPDGQTDVILPDDEGNAREPVPYLQAGIEIGRAFAGVKSWRDKRLCNYYRETEKDKNNGYRLKRFAEQVLLKASQWKQPCLILMEAEWRRWGLLPIGNEAINQDQIAINNSVLIPEQLPGLRLLRIRDSGTLNETPQYVELRDGDNWFDVEDPDDPDVMTGVIDTGAMSPLMHYFSIGRQPDTGKNNNEQLTFESSSNAHRHQQAIEFVPFFLQPGDEASVYCRIAHFLRSSPAWRSGNTVLPYPLHLAKTLIADQMDVFDPTI